MTMVTWSTPSALWLLLVVPVIWLVMGITRSTYSKPQRIVQAALRSSLLALVALALARPVVSATSSHLAVVYAVDVSHSVAKTSLLSTADRIDTFNAELHPDHSRILVFGGRSTHIADTAALRALANAEVSPADDPLDRGSTDLERALIEARADLVTGGQVRLVLFSDGRATSGDVMAAASRLATDGIPVFVDALEARAIGDAFVDGVDVPTIVPASSAVPIAVAIWNQGAPADATIEVRDDVKVVGTGRARLSTGATTVPIDVTFATPGSHVVHVRLIRPGDPLEANNELAREVIVSPRGRVLYVESSTSSAHYLRLALEQSGFDVTVAQPAALPAHIQHAESFDAVILSDVARKDLPDTTMAQLAAWVERDGGGLLFAGGEAVFGQGPDEARTGYRHTEVERLLPVTIERKDEPDVALVMVLDKSWSMAGTVMELCKAAAQGAVDALSDQQTVGVLSFDDRLNWDVTPRNVGQNRQAIQSAITKITPGGDTLIFPALEQAYLELRKVRAGAKHVILLSDGRSYPDDYQGLVTKMVAAGMTVSSVAVGKEADAQLLGNIAKWGKGRAYVVLDAKEVAQVFVKEAKAAMPAFEEGAQIQPLIKARSVLGHVDLSKMPDLRGRTAMVAKAGATVVLATKRDDPLLAWWPIGRGRTAAFASDVKDRWATDWLTWSSYAPFFSAVVHGIARQRPQPIRLEVIREVERGDTRSLAVAVEARDARDRYRDLLKPTVDARVSGGAGGQVVARQVAPGRYEATVTAPRHEPVVLTVRGSDADEPVIRHVVPDSNAEYRLRPSDRDVLQAVAAATGGRIDPTPADLTPATSHVRRTSRALWPWLLLAACALWPLDILARRIRFFEAEVGNDRLAAD